VNASGDVRAVLRLRATVARFASAGSANRQRHRHGGLCGASRSGQQLRSDGGRGRRAGVAAVQLRASRVGGCSGAVLDLRDARWERVLPPHRDARLVPRG
jgi:hypothetical protein